MNWRDFQPPPSMEKVQKTQKSTQNGPFTGLNGLNRQEGELHNLSNFCTEAAFELIRKVNSSLNSAYPPGSIPWAGINRSGLMRHTRAAESAVDDAFHKGDTQALLWALEWYERAYRAIFQAFLASSAS